MDVEALAVVAAIELSVRNPVGVEWVDQIWDELAPVVGEGVLRIRPGPVGTIVGAWPSDCRDDMLAEIADLALKLGEHLVCLDRSVELRGGIEIGVIGPGDGSDAVERAAEGLALAAAPGQWLVAGEVARRLESSFEFRGVGIVPRWPLPLTGTHRALIARVTAPVLPSAVSGDPPDLVLGRDVERGTLLAELATAANGRRRVILVSAPAGGGKSHLLRRVLADTELEVAAGVAFPPLGARTLGPVRALLSQLDSTVRETAPAAGIGAQLAVAASARAREHPAVIVVDDVHWGDSTSLAALREAIVASDSDAPLVWVLSARTASLPQIADLVAVSDVAVSLPPLSPSDRPVLLERRLRTVPDELRQHVQAADQRGNPLYLEHLAAILNGPHPPDTLPGSLHEAVLARLDELAARAHELTRWPRASRNPRGVEVLEREVGDWLDRLETSDLADLETIGRYLGRLRRVDFELVIARAVLGMPVSSNRRLTQTIERLAAASTSALLDYLTTITREGRAGQAVEEARTAARRAELALRLADAARLLAFACEFTDKAPELRCHLGDLALALGRPAQALAAYRAVGEASGTRARLDERTARAEATVGRAELAIQRLEHPSTDGTADQAYVRALDLARLRHTSPPTEQPGYTAAVRRQAARVAAWASSGESEAAHVAARLLTLDGEPAACAAELIETAVLARIAGLQIQGLQDAADQAAQALGNPIADCLLDAADPRQARDRFLHWET